MTSPFSLCRKAVRVSVMVATASLLWQNAVRAEAEANSISEIHYKENLIRSVQFIKTRAFADALFFDRGSFTLNATLGAKDVDFAQISESAQLEIEFHTADAEFTTTVAFGDDPNFHSGERTAVIQTLEPFKDREHLVRTVEINLDPDKQTVQVRIHGRYLAITLSPDDSIEAAGENVFADEKLGGETRHILQGAQLTIRLVAAEETLAQGTSEAVVTGEARKKLHRRKTGTYPAYHIELSGEASHL